MDLTFEEVRVLGCLVEKSANTPEHYPLTSNSLTAACNQKTSREPVVQFSTRLVDETIMLLRQAGLARSNMGGRASKHRHIMDEALGLTLNQTIVLSVLMLRGPQSAGELKTRTDRAIGFDDVGDVDQVLKSLAERDDPFVRDVGRGSGQSMNRWVHLIGGEPRGEPAPSPLSSQVPLSSQAPPSSQVPLSSESKSAQSSAPSPRTVPAPTVPPRAPQPSNEQLVKRVAELEERLARIEAELGL